MQQLRSTGTPLSAVPPDVLENIRQLRARVATLLLKADLAAKRLAA
jgi:hypothetical protein